MHIQTHVWLAASTLAVVALGSISVLPVDAQARAKVTGTISYLNRSALPDNAEITVQLADVSRQDVASTVLAEQTFISGGKQVPFPFELNYDPATIDDRFTYAVQATIMVDGKLMYRNTQAYPVITRGRPTTVDVIVQRIGDTAPQPTAGVTIAPRPVTPTPEAEAAGGAPRTLPATDGDTTPAMVGLGALALLAGGLFVRLRMKRPVS